MDIEQMMSLYAVYIRQIDTVIMLWSFV